VVPPDSGQPCHLVGGPKTPGTPRGKVDPRHSEFEAFEWIEGNERQVD